MDDNTSEPSYSKEVLLAVEQMTRIQKEPMNLILEEAESLVYPEFKDFIGYQSTKNEWGEWNPSIRGYDCPPCDLVWKADQKNSAEN